MQALQNARAEKIECCNELRVTEIPRLFYRGPLPYGHLWDKLSTNVPACSIAIAHLVVHRTLKLIHLAYLPIL